MNQWAIWMRREDEHDDEAILVPIPQTMLTSPPRGSNEHRDGCSVGTVQVWQLVQHIYTQKVFPFTANVQVGDIQLQNARVPGVALPVGMKLTKELFVQVGQRHAGGSRPILVVAIRRGGKTAEPAGMSTVAARQEPKPTNPQHFYPQKEELHEDPSPPPQHPARRTGVYLPQDVAWDQLPQNPYDSQYIVQQQHQQQQQFLQHQHNLPAALYEQPPVDDMRPDRQEDDEGDSAPFLSGRGRTLVDCCALVGSPMPINWQGSPERHYALSQARVGRTTISRSPVRSRHHDARAEDVNKHTTQFDEVVETSVRVDADATPPPLLGHYLLPEEQPTHPLPMSTAACYHALDEKHAFQNAQVAEKDSWLESRYEVDMPSILEKAREERLEARSQQRAAAREASMLSDVLEFIDEGGDVRGSPQRQARGAYTASRLRNYLSASPIIPQPMDESVRDLRESPLPLVASFFAPEDSAAKLRSFNEEEFDDNPSRIGNIALVDQHHHPSDHRLYVSSPAPSATPPSLRKELAAACNAYAPRWDAPTVCVNCGEAGNRHLRALLHGGGWATRQSGSTRRNSLRGQSSNRKRNSSNRTTNSSFNKDAFIHLMHAEQCGASSRNLAEDSGATEIVRKSDKRIEKNATYSVGSGMSDVNGHRRRAATTAAVGGHFSQSSENEKGSTLQPGADSTSTIARSLFESSHGDVNNGAIHSV